MNIKNEYAPGKLYFQGLPGTNLLQEERPQIARLSSE